MVAALRNSIYVRLLVLFSAALVPIISLSFLLNHATVRELSQSRVENMELQIDSKIDYLENELQRIYRSQQLFLLRETLPVHFAKQYPDFSSFALGQEVKQLNESIQNLSLYSDLIENVELYFPEDSISVSVSEYYSDSVEPEYEQFYAQSDASYGKIRFFADRLQMILPHSVSGMNGRTVDYILNIQLSSWTVLDLLHNIDKDAGVALIGESWSIADQHNLQTVSALETSVTGAKSDSGAHELKMEILGQSHYVIYRYSPLLDAYLVSFLPEASMTGGVTRYQQFLWVLVGLAILTAIATAYTLHRMIRKPLGQLIKAFSRAELGELQVTVPRNGSNEFGMLQHKFNQMVENLRVLIQETYIKNLELNRARLKQLQAQIAPHFLYNSFNVLKHAIYMEDQEVAGEMSDRLGKYFQYITHNDKDEITLLEEYNHARNYIEIQKLRYGERIQSRETELLACWHRIRVPRLIIQPLVENIFQHGIHHRQHGSRILIKVFEEDDTLNVLVADNGDGLSALELHKLSQGLDDGDLGQHTGLVNVHQRLRLKFGARAGLLLDSRQGCYFAVRLVIPLFRDRSKEGEGHVRIIDR